MSTFLQRTAPLALIAAFLLLTAGCGPSQREARHALAEADVPFSEAEFAQRAGAGDRDTLQLFFDAGMALNAAPEEREAFPLIDAASGGHVEAVEMLLERGADPNVEDEDGRAALLLAADGGEDTTDTEAARSEIVGALLAAGAAPNTVNRQRTSRGMWSRTPLRYAAENGYASAVRQLLDAGAEMTGRGSRFEDLLFEAARGEHTETFEVLLKERDPSSNMATLTAMSCTGKADRVSRLLDVGVTPDANHGGPFEGSDVTALICASGRGHKQVVETLLSAGANPNGQVGYQSSTPLMEASRGGHAGIARMLLEAGADVDEKVASDAEEQTALMAAAANGFAESVRTLLNAGADPSIAGTERTESGLSQVTALRLASSAGHSQVANLLKEAGAESSPRSSRSPEVLTRHEIFAAQRTIDILRRGLSKIPMNLAVKNTEKWQRRLREEDASEFDRTASTLERLQEELRSRRIDGVAVGRLLSDLGEQTRSLAARRDSSDRLDGLGRLLSKAGQQLQ